MRASKTGSARQTIAIGKVNGATTIYSDDNNLISFAEANGIPCTRVADLPIPEAARQQRLPLAPPDETKT